ncbi:MAG: hypothetical protein LBG65_04355 [Puniceicoccales bacterium]|jgi:hypothetical protein|nr:hypothetical protein [Puniceicoccales bacterium]
MFHSALSFAQATVLAVTAPPAPTPGDANSYMGWLVSALVFLGASGGGAGIALWATKGEKARATKAVAEGGVLPLADWDAAARMGDLQSVRVDVAKIEDELHARISKLRDDVKADGDARQSVLLAELRALRTEFREDSKAANTELFRRLSEMEKAVSRLDGRMTPFAETSAANSSTH